MGDTLDKIYLELSNITKARNKREAHADHVLRKIWHCLENPTSENIKSAKDLIDVALKVMDS